MPLEDPDTSRGWARMLAPREPEERLERLAQYYAAVTMIDEQIGALLDDLEGRGELANTLVVYTADHGHMNGQHGLYTKGNATVPQNFYEESIRIPALLSWPGHFPAGQVPRGTGRSPRPLPDAAGRRAMPARPSLRRRTPVRRPQLPTAVRRAANGMA